jgi:hypothetical protein
MSDFMKRKIGYLAAFGYIGSKMLHDLSYIYGRFFGWGDCVMVGGCGTAISEILYTLLGIAAIIYIVDAGWEKEGDRL